MKSIYINPPQTRQYILEEDELTTLYNAHGLYIKNEDGDLEQWMPEEDYMVDKDGTEVLYFNQGGQYLFGDTLEFFNEDGSPANLEDTGDDMQVLLSFNGSNSYIERLEHDFDLSDEVVSFMDRLGIDLEEFLNIEEETVKGSFNTIKLRDFATEDTVLRWAIENGLKVNMCELYNCIIENIITHEVMEQVMYGDAESNDMTMFAIYKLGDHGYAFISNEFEGDTNGGTYGDLDDAVEAYVSEVLAHETVLESIMYDKGQEVKPQFVMLTDGDEAASYDEDGEWTNDNGGETDGNVFILPISYVPEGMHSLVSANIIPFSSTEVYQEAIESNRISRMEDYWFGINNKLYILTLHEN